MNVALILAKSGSIGLPGKNLLELNGKSLLAHTISDAYYSACFENIYVSTNSNEIAQVASEYGAKVIIRPDDLAQNNRYVDSVNHAIQNMGCSPATMTIPQVVQPLRELGLFKRMLELHSPGVDSIVTVTPFEASLDWVYSKDEKDGQLAPLKQIIYTQDIARRSDLFMIDNAVVSFTYNSWQRSEGVTPWPYLGKNIIGIEQNHLNAHYNIDINTPDDAEWLEFIKQFPKWREQRS